MNARSAKIVKGGRLILPADYRRALDLNDGDSVVIELDHDELRVRSVRGSFARVREQLRPYLPKGVSLADELSRDRTREAACE